MREDTKPNLQGFGVLGLELGRSTLFHRLAVVRGKWLFVIARKAGPKVFAYQCVRLQDRQCRTVCEGAIPMPVNADDRILERFKHLLELACGLAAGIASRSA